MDRGLFNTPRPTDKQTSARTEPTTRSGVEPARPEARATMPGHHSEPASKHKKSRKRLVALLLGIIFSLIIAGVAVWLIVTKTGGLSTAIDSNKYQAVFFTNGQVYFGKLSELNANYMKLTDIYYLQTQTSDETDSKNPQETSSAQSGVQLIKLGDEVHGPEDLMMISRDQVLFIENLKSDGKVAQTIEQSKKK